MPQFNNHIFKENLKNFQENVFGKIFEIPILKYTRCVRYNTVLYDAV